MDEFFKKVTMTFSRTDTSGASDLTLYARPVDPDLEVIAKLDREIASYEQDIQKKQTQCEALLVQMNQGRQLMKTSAKGQPAYMAAQNKAIQALKKQKSLQQECGEMEQVKATMEQQVGRLKRLRRAKNAQDLVKESTLRMQMSAGELESTDVADMVNDTRRAASNADKLTGMVFDPFALDIEGTNEALALELEQFDLLDDEMGVVVVVDQPLPQQQRAVQLNSNNNNSSGPKLKVLDDDY